MYKGDNFASLEIILIQWYRGHVNIWVTICILGQHFGSEEVKVRHLLSIDLCKIREIHEQS